MKRIISFILCGFAVFGFLMMPATMMAEEEGISVAEEERVYLESCAWLEEWTGIALDAEKLPGTVESVCVIGGHTAEVTLLLQEGGSCVLRLTGDENVLQDKAAFDGVGDERYDESSVPPDICEGDRAERLLLTVYTSRESGERVLFWCDRGICCCLRTQVADGLQLARKISAALN